MGPVVRAASLRGFLPLVAGLGGDGDRYLERFGIPVEALRAEDGLISLTDHDRMLDAVADELGCPDLGLRLAASQDISVLGPLALAIASSPTVADAVACVGRFLFVHSPALSVAVAADPRGRRGVVALTYRKDLGESPYSPQATELGLGVFHRVAASLLETRAGRVSGLRSVELPHQPLSPVSRYTEVFGVDVRFGSATAALCVDQHVLDLGFAEADEAIRDLAIAHLARRYPDPGTRTDVRVRRAVAERLGVSSTSLAEIAGLLAVHPRTLQRRLAAEGSSSFEGVVDDVRRAAAHRYLTTTDLPLGQVASLVGFTEQSTLSHAVRRWYGASPRELRSSR